MENDKENKVKYKRAPCDTDEEIRKRVLKEYMIQNFRHPCGDNQCDRMLRFMRIFLYSEISDIDL